MKAFQMLLTAAAAASVSLVLDASAQNRGDRFRAHGPPDTEDASVVDANTPPGRRFLEALTGFDSLTNGYLDQGPDFDALEEDAVVPFRSFNDDRFIFEEVERRADGLGPVYNAQSCRECHQNVATGGASQVAEHRTGRLEGGVFFESLGGSLIHSRATDPRIVERVSPADKVRTFRISTNTLGDGFIEAIPNTAILAVAAAVSRLGALLQLGFGLLGDRFGAARVLVLALLAQAIVALGYITARQLGTFYTVAALFGFTYAGVMPLFAVIARENFPLRMMGTVIGGTTMASSLGMALGPVVGGLIYDTTSTYTWLFIGAFALGIGAFLSALAFTRLPRRQAMAAAA